MKTMISLVKKLHPQGIPWPASILYNRLSRTRIFREHYRLVAREIAGENRSYQGIRILDIGTGPGYLLREIALHMPGARITGMDISPAMTDQARQNLAGRNTGITICGGDAARLPFRDKAFGCVVSTGALHHWKDPHAALEDIFRVLQPGGRAFLYDLIRRPPPDLRKKIRQEFGRFRMSLLWLHSFEEPFMTSGEMATLADHTRLRTTGVGFTGGLCCLELIRDN